ncbi:MBL fold metallo-hydrolase [uncultured Draconibacterium sp.]|uniref:MBL fold metallo-hydrolase n=1 Tax=uncultured Draconibacterium sp. TaxID=1573823 RepID=UPI003260EE20
MLITIIVLAVLVALFFVVTGQARFGAVPQSNRLKQIKKSPNYSDGKFQNLSPTPQMSEDARFFPMLKEYFSAQNKKPNALIPSVKTDLTKISKDENILLWFGHSSYYIQIEGKSILVDPVFSGHASPFSFSVKAFKGANDYQVEDMPEIDYLIITHDHWDHLDYETVVKLKSKTDKVITGLGVGAHFERWGFNASKLIENDWFDRVDLGNGFVLHCTPARHFSGRGFKAKQSLWCSFVLESPSKKIFIGGDSGYDNHFKVIGEKYGPFDLVMLENGQYNKAWKYIHMMPEQVLLAAKDLKAKRFFPVHSGKFALANHAWNEPLNRISEVNKNNEIPMLTPKIGEIVNLDDSLQQFSRWWLELD